MSRRGMVKAGAWVAFFVELAIAMFCGVALAAATLHLGPFERFDWRFSLGVAVGAIFTGVVTVASWAARNRRIAEDDRYALIVAIEDLENLAESVLERRGRRLSFSTIGSSLLERGVWSSDEVDDFAAVMNVRNLIVHSPEQVSNDEARLALSRAAILSTSLKGAAMALNRSVVDDAASFEATVLDALAPVVSIVKARGAGGGEQSLSDEAPVVVEVVYRPKGAGRPAIEVSDHRLNAARMGEPTLIVTNANLIPSESRKNDQWLAENLPLEIISWSVDESPARLLKGLARVRVRAAEKFAG